MVHRKSIYLDNAATTFPKPPEVLQEMVDAYSVLGVSPGRGSYDLSVEAENRVTKLRHQLCQLFEGGDPEHVIFCYNATDALNLLIRGMITPGCHIVSSRLEHNSVLRPLHHFRQQGLIDFDLVHFDQSGIINPKDVYAAIKPNTVFTILTHASNVLGTVQPVKEIGGICRAKGVPLFLDVTQTAGLIPIRMNEWGVSAVAFTGHKSLLGPTGIGGLVLDSSLDVKATRFGGTGRESGSLVHNQEYPYRLEIGTINILGIFGLSAGLRYIGAKGIETIRMRELRLAERLWAGLNVTNRVKVYGGGRYDDGKVPVVLCNIEGINAEDVAAILDGDYGVATRAGLHCAPLVHTDIGIYPQGGVRFSMGPLNTVEEIDEVLEAVASMVGR